MIKTVLLAALLIPLFASAQTPPPAFEVASITPCKPGTPEPAGEHAGMVQFTLPGGRFDAKATTLKFLLEWAYDMQPSQHSDGPAWFGSDRYDIAAKAAGNASDSQMKRMARTLLAERFHMKSHFEKKTVSALVLTTGKAAPRVFPPKEGEVHSMRFVPQMGPDQKIASYHIILTRFSIAELSGAFARQLGQVVVDKTGLDGDFDFTMDLTPDESRASPLDASLLISALHDQIGLTVKSEKTPVDYLVIDAIEKVAAGN
jgi:uncharacterized protein (TIGR03435 family)